MNPRKGLLGDETDRVDRPFFVRIFVSIVLILLDYSARKGRMN